MSQLAGVESLLAATLANIQPLHTFDLTLLEAHGCLLAEDVSAPTPLPGFDSAGLDGYAVRAADLAGASEATPVTLPVVGDISAGSTTPYTVQPGLSVRIVTGAPLPPGADAIVPIEDTDGGVAQVSVRRPPAPGRFMRRAGEDAPAGAVVLPAGSHLGATQIGLLAAVGRERITVRPRPRMVVFATGSELAEAGQQLGHGQVHDANSVLLTVAAREAGAIAYRVGVVPDDPRELMASIEDQLIRADLVVTTGGVSASGYDIVRETLSRQGTVGFQTVAISPRASIGIGAIGPDRTPFFALPGNPVAAYVCFEVFVRPVIRRMLGVDPIQRPSVRARLVGSIVSPAGIRSFIPAQIGVADGAYQVVPVDGVGSGMVAAFATANAMVVVPEDVTTIESGSVVTSMLLERRQQ